MSDEADESLEGQAVARPPRTRPRPWHDWTEARTRFKDLLVVFFGVYAAFLLNRYESDRRDDARRHQLLEALDHEVAPSVDELKVSLVDARASIAEFDRALAAGEMPRLGISYSTSGYSASDDATLLQAGGLELLDVETLDQLRKVNDLQRSLDQRLRFNFQLELTLLGGRDSADFYDPATRQLRRQYAWFPTSLHGLLKELEALQAGEERFLTLIRARRDRR